MNKQEVEKTKKRLALALNVAEDQLIYCEQLRAVLLKKRCEERKNKQTVKKGLFKNKVIMIGGTFFNKQDTSFRYCDMCKEKEEAHGKESSDNVIDDISSKNYFQ